MKLDAAFFQRVLRKDGGGPEDDEAPDYDLYLMEKGLMPVLLQGLDALSRHVEKVNQGGGLSGGGRVPFNPLTWLAQYLLRNHPGKTKDHRTPIYKKLGEMANIERGRRCILRRRGQMNDEWQEFIRGRGQITVEDLPEYLQLLDDRWNLEGAFVSKMPQDFRELIHVPGGIDEVLFVDFWAWFESFVSENDVLRAAEFDEAISRKAEAERQAREAEEEMERRELAMQEVLEQRRNLTDQFASISADLYTNDIITQIVNKGAIIEGLEEQPGGVPLQGEHVELIVAMLRLWGCVAEPVPEDTWDGSALGAWEQWVEQWGPSGVEPRVDSTNLRQLMDPDAFEKYIVHVYPAPDKEATIDMQQVMEVRTLVDGEDIDVYVEAIDEVTGERRQLYLPANQVEEVRRRLAGDEPVLARVDTVSQRVTGMLPAGCPVVQ